MTTTTPASPRATGRRAAALALAALLAVTAASCSSSGSDSSAAKSTDGATTTTAAKTGTSGKTGTGADTTTTESAAPVDLAARPYESHVPTSYKAETPAPLLLVLHGYGANGPGQVAYMGLTGAADRAGVLLAYPDGTTNAMDKKNWNATDACCGGPKATVDDSSYLAAVIADMQSRYSVDPKRIFVMGHSNGGFMSYRMACDHADTIAAIAVVEGATWNDPSKCAPANAVAVLAIHGTADETITYEGEQILGRAYPGAVRSTKTWARYNGCRVKADAGTTETHDLVKDLDPATVTSYTDGCDEGGDVELWTQPEGTHIPAWTDTFGDQVIAWLQAHPKP